MSGSVPDPMSPLDGVDSSQPSDESGLDQPAEASSSSAPKISTTRYESRKRREQSKKRANRSLMILSITAGVSVVAGVSWFALNPDRFLQSRNTRTATDDADAAPGDNEPVEPTREVPDKRAVTKPRHTVEHATEEQWPADDSSVRPVEQPDSGDKTPDVSELPPTVELSSEERRELKETLSMAFDLLSEQDFRGSKSQINKAREIAQTSRYDEMVERLDTLYQYVQEFYNAVEDGFTQIEDTELIVDGRRVYVVEVTDEHLVIRDRGKNKRHARADLSDELLVAIADRWFDQGAASTRVFKGAYMAVSAEYSDDDARRMWDQARREGVDLSDLMLVLEDRAWYSR